MAFVYWYIRDFFIFLGRIIIFVVSLIWSVIEILISAVAFLGKVVVSLPAWISIPAGVLIVVCVLYKILGRENQS